VFFRKQKLVAV